MSTPIEPVSPGELLSEEFLKPMGISQYRLAKEISVPAQRIGQIVLGRRRITADTDLRLCRFFGLTDGYWLHAQNLYDLEATRKSIGSELNRIKPWAAAACKLYAPKQRGEAAESRPTLLGLRARGEGASDPLGRLKLGSTPRD